MKKFIFGLLLMVCSFPTLAEVVSSVSFNPSRMGEYTYLKVTDKANLKGGLDTPVLNIQSGGTVSMQTDSSSRLYEIPTVKGETNSRIDMPNTAFHGNTANTYSSYESKSSTTPTGLLADVNVKGGTQTYKKDSYIQTLRAVNILKQKATTLKGGLLVKLIEPPCTERYARWCERSVGEIIAYLLLDLSGNKNGGSGQSRHKEEQKNVYLYHL